MNVYALLLHDDGSESLVALVGATDESEIPPILCALAESTVPAVIAAQVEGWMETAS